MTLFKALRQLVSLLLVLVLAPELAWRLTTAAQHEYVAVQYPGIPLPNSYSSGLWMPLLGIQTQQQRLEQLERQSQQQLERQSSPLLVGQSADKNSVERHMVAGRCVTPESLPVAQPKQQQVFRWVDEQGKIHFGDRPDASDRQQPVDDLSARYRSQRKLELHVTLPDGPDAGLEADIQREGELVYRVVATLLPARYVRPVLINMTVFTDAVGYQAQRRSDNVGEQAAGYYHFEKNRIYLQRQYQREATLALVRHEMTHALSMAMVGTLPVWLGEGLAEYTEQLDYQMSAARVVLSERLLASLRQQTPLPLSQYLLLQPESFYQQGSRHYRQALALVFFLNSSQEGKVVLERAYEAVIDSPCQAAAVNATLAFYPGGLAGLEAAFGHWLADGPHLPQSY